MAKTSCLYSNNCSPSLQQAAFVRIFLGEGAAIPTPAPPSHPHGPKPTRSANGSVTAPLRRWKHLDDNDVFSIHVPSAADLHVVYFVLGTIEGMSRFVDVMMAPPDLAPLPRGATGEFLAQNLDVARPPPRL